MRHSRLCCSRNIVWERIWQRGGLLVNWNHHLYPVSALDLFLLSLCGFPPFYDDNNEELFDTIKKGEFDFPEPYWDDISDSAKDLIKKLLEVDINKRLDADGIMKHPWIDAEQSKVELPQVTEKIREYNAKRRMRVSLNF